MGKWALWAAAVFSGSSLTLSAQTTQQFDLLELDQTRRHMVSTQVLDFSALNSPYYRFPAMTLLDGRRLWLSNAYTWIKAPLVEFLPERSTAISSVSVRMRETPAPASDDKTVEVKPKLIDYVHGEVSVLYGTSLGSKFGCEMEAGYILGEIGNDKYRINVGAFYEHSSAHLPQH